MNGYREKRCPLCGKKIWADAVFCRFCNRDLDDEDLIRSSRSIRKTALGLLLFFGAIVLIALILQFR